MVLFYFSKIMKKLMTSLFLFAFLLAGFAPVSTYAVVCTTDEDNDGYYPSPNPDADVIAAPCDGTIGLQGYELPICNCPDIRDGAPCNNIDIAAAATPGTPRQLTIPDINALYDYLKWGNKKGRSFNPAASDTPGDGIDQNCDGVDAQVTKATTDVPDLIEQAITFLGSIVAGVSTLFLIWGAIMYASASGDEEKMRKARKTMIGAIIGLIIGILAWQLIGLVIKQVA
jgi:hypothetical protein